MKKVLVCLILFISIFMLTGCMSKEDEEREKVFDSINKDIVNTGLVSSNWKYVASKYSWSGEMPNYREINYFYIDKNVYDEYKYYWLEDVDESEYKDGLNRMLGTIGNKVFYDINIYELGEQSDGDYRGVSTIPNTKYYLIDICDNVLYYRYISAHGEDMDSYSIIPIANTSDANTIKEYLAHLENNKWIYEEIKEQ